MAPIPSAYGGGPTLPVRIIALIKFIKHPVGKAPKDSACFFPANIDIVGDASESFACFHI
jgi:hypothetical protein